MELSPGESGESTTPELHIPRGSSSSGSNFSGDLGSPVAAAPPYGPSAHHHPQYSHGGTLSYGRNSYSPTSTSAPAYNANQSHPQIQNAKFEASVHSHGLPRGAGSPVSSHLHEVQRMDTDKFSLTPTQVKTELLFLLSGISNTYSLLS